jgi:carbon-monoxide dehydrogenase large subunit
MSQPFSIGTGTRRVEDARFVSGRGRYSDDIALPGMVFAAMVRSTRAHARILSIDFGAATAAEGVIAVLTGAELADDGIGDLPCSFRPPPPTGTTVFAPPYPLLVSDKVRYVGDRVAMVIARSAIEARLAAELVEIDYDDLPAVTDIALALRGDAPKVWDEAGGNLCFHIERGERDAVDRAFAGAAHVVKLTSRYPRINGTPIEPRSCIGVRDPLSGRYTLYTGTQSPHRSRDMLAGSVLKIPLSELRIVVHDIGGGFGLKGAPYPEDALVLWAAARTGLPVKWTSDRAEALQADLHGRDRLDESELAFDAAGRILAMRSKIIVNTGAYLTSAAGVTSINAERLSSPYHVPLCHTIVQTAITNTSPLGPYRGTGRPESNLLFERAMDRAALQLGIDRIELRRRNLVTPSQMPYKTAGAYSIDSGDFAMVLDKTLTFADWAGFAARRKESESRGALRGIGLGVYVILSGSTNQPERVELRVDIDGTITLLAGTQSSGQGHETMYTQLASEWLGVPPERIRVVQGDTDRILFGRGTAAGRSAMMGGSALRLAADDLIAHGKQFAAWMLEAAAADIEFAGGKFRIAGTHREISFDEVARRSQTTVHLPAHLPVGFQGIGGYSGEPSFPNGCAVCEVEINRDTGEISIERVCSLSDSGHIINPLTLDGQIHGSIAQAAGEMLIEEVLYDADSGQLLTGSLSDYALPRADMFPAMQTGFVSIPALTNPLGVKGGSEMGSAGIPAALYNAIIDALGKGVAEVPIPATAERVWRALRETPAA